MKLKLVCTLVLSLFFSSSYAVCIINQSAYPMSYHIQNKNRINPYKLKSYRGTVKAFSKVCHANNRQQDPNWQVYRFDFITTDIIDSNGANKRVCAKNVNGILNFLEIELVANRWYCLDSFDYED